MTTESSDGALLRSFAIPGPQLGPVPMLCPFCGRRWTGLADDGRFTACCSIPRWDALRWLENLPFPEVSP